MRPSSRLAPFVVCLVVAVAAGASSAFAQTPTVVRLRVRDEGSTPVAGAEVAVVHGVREVVAGGATGETGTAVLGAVLAGGEYHVVVRKRGFERVERFFTAGVRDTVALDLVVPSAATIAGAAAWQPYVVDAETIAATTPPVADVPEILSRLRPAMLQGIPGDDACRPVRDVRVNDAPVPDAPVPDAPVRAAASHPSAAPHVLAVLRSIRPEHVAEMRNAGCTRDAGAPAGGAGVLSIALKPGIAYEPGVGSHAADAPGRSAPDRPLAPLAPYRSRLLVVYDAINGEPIAGVEVTHVASGARALTNLAGTVALGFLPEGESSVRLSRTGYQPIEVPVTISPADDRPITLLLRRAK